MSAKKRFQQLVQAFHLHDRATVEALLVAGVGPDTAACNDAGDSLLVLAVRGSRADMVALLSAHGADPARANRVGETARSLGAASTVPRIAELYSDADPVDVATLRLFEIIGRVADRPRTIGAVADDILGLASVADLAFRRHGRTPLLALAAAGVRHDSLYARLVGAGADPTATDDTGATVLHHLVARDALDEARQLVAVSAIDARDGLGRTALHLAALERPDHDNSRAAAFVGMLLDHGASPAIRDALGRTPLERAGARARLAMLDRPGVSVRGDLELALRARWDEASLAILGDLLLVDGDPRGELIALDLAPDARSSKWRDRRNEILDRWLGKDLARRALHLLRYGFVTHLHDRGGASFTRRAGSSKLATELLASPAGTYVRSFSVSGSPERVLAVLARLASEPRPWLTSLAIVGSGARTVHARSTLVDELIDATPSLRTLFVPALPIFVRFPHPRLERVIARVPIADLAVAVEPPSVVTRDGLAALLESIELDPALAVDDRVAELAAAGLVDLRDARVRLTALGHAAVHDDDEDRAT